MVLFSFSFFFLHTFVFYLLGLRNFYLFETIKFGAQQNFIHSPSNKKKYSCIERLIENKKKIVIRILLNISFLKNKFHLMHVEKVQPQNKLFSSSIYLDSKCFTIHSTLTLFSMCIFFLYTIFLGLKNLVFLLLSWNYDELSVKQNTEITMWVLWIIMLIFINFWFFWILLHPCHKK